MRMKSPVLARSGEQSQPTVGLMRRILKTAGALILPIVGVAFAVLWILGAANRIDATLPIEWIPYALIGVAIGLSRIYPRIAIGLSVLVLGLQITVHRLRFEVNGAPYLGLLIVFLVIVLSARIRPGALSIVIWVSGSVTLGVLFAMYTGFSFNGALIAVLASLVIFAGGFSAKLALQRTAERQRSLILETEIAATATELAIALERDRTAQDVHDIMAHSLAVIVAQADGALFLGKKRPAAVTESLKAIAQSARDSLGELRVLLESLSSTPEGHSYPSLANVDVLLERMRGAGLTVSDEAFGEPTSLTAGQELAVYRILQESLTNALKHSGSDAFVRITSDWRGPGLALSIVSLSSTDLIAVESSHISRGITGMTERARLAGGWLSAALDADDPRCFMVTAFIPTNSVEASATSFVSTPVAPVIAAHATEGVTK